MKTEKKSMQRDLVGRGIIQWQTARPDIDSSGKEVIGRLIHLGTLVLRRVEQVLQPFQLSYFEYAVLATLRVATEPHGLSPNALIDRLLCSSGGLSNVVKRLEGRGLLNRSADPEDGRGVLVQLTGEGKALADRAMPIHAQTERALVAGLSKEEQATLAGLLAKMLGASAKYIS